MAPSRNERSWWLLASALVWLLIFTAKPVSSQKIDRNNTMLRWYCSLYRGMNEQVFLKNLNTTLSSIRKQLSRANNYHAVSKTVVNGESVYGQALCRAHLSAADCLACFDAAVAYLKVCGLGNGAHVFYDDCDLRYENKNFYDEAIIRISIGICGNKTSSHPKELKETGSGLLSDVRTAIPRTPNLFAASMRPITGTNATVYAMAQCGPNITQFMCVQCLKLRQRVLDDCLPSTTGRAFDDGCFMRYSETPFFELDQTTDITPYFRNGNSRTKKSIIGGVIGGVGFLFFILAFLFWYHQMKRSKHHRSEGGNSTGATDLLQKTNVYTYKDLKMATNNFSNENKIGGGFNSMYKGVLKDRNIVAIKKIAMATKRGKAYLDGEIQILSNVHHRHLIRLLGYCRKGPQLYLVLEYMENGSLDKFLYGDKRGSLNWQQRFDIIYGTAKGIAYLHEQYHVTIIHRDIKPTNILLDDKFQPKITDFGLVKLLPGDKTHISTKVTSTLSNGYIAPEYTMKGQLSQKIDIYSFGIIILEIISGKWCNDMVENEFVSQNLIDHARSLYENDKHLNLIDVTLDQSEYVTEDAKKIIEIALMCTHPTASMRPSMSDVVVLLSERSSDVRCPTIRSRLDNYDMKIVVDDSLSAS